MVPSAANSIPGSPPTRGTRVECRGLGVGLGLIPAHAGNTPGSRSRWCPAWAHPRSRGEHSTGTRPGGVGGGLIPAHAGNTSLRTSWCLRLGAHPRSRGEHQADVEHTTGREGSSPLTRGTRLRRRGRYRPIGLIPAHAGNTCARVTVVSSDEAHPRSRGEHRPCSRLPSRPVGSSPLTRGTPPPPTSEK